MEGYYARDAYRRQLGTRITNTGVEDGRRWLELEDTVLYPEGGGQPADQGHAIVTGGPAPSDLRIVDVQKVDGVPRHFLAPDETSDEENPAGIAPGAELRLELDWPRRFDHMQQHSAQHLLSALADDRFGWPTTAFHLGAEVCDIEVAAPSIEPPELAALEEAVAEAIRRDLAIVITQRLPEMVDFSHVRSRGLPEGHRGLVRLVSINGVDVSTCGGTHLRSTAEIESLRILDASPMRGGTRITWVAGARVRRRLGRHEARNAELRKVLGAGDDELVSVAHGKLEQIKELGRQLKAAEGRWAEAAAELLGERLRRASAGQPMHEHFDGVGAGPLGQLARTAVKAAPEGLLVVTATLDGSLFFGAAGGEAAADAVSELGKAVAEALDGRGGGKGPFFQGRADALPADEIRRRLAAVTGSPAD